MQFTVRTMTSPLHRVLATAQNGLEVIRFGGLDTGEEASPYVVVERRPMFRLRRYFPQTKDIKDRPPIVLVPPMMVAADVYDVTQDKGAVGILHAQGLDPWVVDFGSPDREIGGMARNLADHVVGVSDVVSLVRKHTGRDVHLGGYSQGGMFCYQVAAYRRSVGLKSVITFGAPADSVALPLGIPVGLASKGADLLADHVFNRLAVPSWMARTGFQMLDPVKTLKSRLDFLMQLHDREALLPREKQRRFLEAEGWVAWSGPAIAELLKQFVVHNRMMTGGFVVDDRLISLAEITCPVLAFLGTTDDIGLPRAVRGIRRAAPRADVYEATLRAGHFGLVVGSSAAIHTWPTVAEWVKWHEGAGDEPVIINPMTDEPQEPVDGEYTVAQRLVNSASQAAEIGFGVAQDLVDATRGAARTTKEITGEAMRTLPRLARLGVMQAHTRMSLGLLLNEQGRRNPLGELFLFDDRVHTHAAVNERIDNVVRGFISVGVRQGSHVGVLMQTRPSALAAIAALSRLGAVSVLLQPGTDLAEAIRIGEVSAIVADPPNLADAMTAGVRVFVLGGGDERDLELANETDVIDMEKIDPAAVSLPAWYRPDPGLASDLAFIVFTRSRGHTEPQFITNHRWALSAFGTASAASLTMSDTVYCLTPLHHPSGLLMTLGGAVAGGARIALTRTFDPSQFAEEIHRYGVTVVSYTWTLLRELVNAEDLQVQRHHPIRLFMGSGMPAALWRRVTERFAPANVVEFYASTEGEAVLANISGAKPGSKGRPIPGSATIRLAAYDVEQDRFIEDDRGFVREAADGDVGRLLAHPRTGMELSSNEMRGVFRAGDAWIATDHLFRRDDSGDYWMVDNRNSVIRTERGVVFALPIEDALAEIDALDLAVVYGVPAGKRTLVIAALSLRLWMPEGASQKAEVKPGHLNNALSILPEGQRPDIVHVVDEIPLTTWYRPKTRALAADGVPAAGVNCWYYDPDNHQYRRLTEAARKRVMADA
ncbi:AMP-binding protein [Hoyosella subflava]|uniref:Possible long-chain acyl-CoA synthase n=1 Tax=Hoyosella subflava (strain DSM 45089 / JCM 17490 / NBRC 109087 / DQS3-9A1) TaxID=443218 RepID=F6EI17_HOYSD|nr:AMP-binding protein [Hoyosella subflava]AEF39966.1 Possible long-chain acyl-CoA synthase [Hoyosella subflava DQS3-9A1]